MPRRDMSSVGYFVKRHPFDGTDCTHLLRIA
jgi:hypothetical protein